MAEAWEAVTGPGGKHLQHPHAKLFYARLDLNHVLGWGSHRANRPTNYPEFLRWKAQYPDKLIALRASNKGPLTFVGIDAVVVCEKLGLKMKGEKIATRCVQDGARLHAQPSRSCKK